MNKEYQIISDYYEKSFAKHGDTPKGLAWQNEESMATRFKVMRELARTPGTLLDLGCGTGWFYPYLQEHAPELEYRGADISEKFIRFCKDKYKSDKFIQVDAVKDNKLPDTYDYIVLNGIFTVKDSLSFDEMADFFKILIAIAFNHANKGIAFNLMSKQVDWERDDLFHVSLDTLASFLVKDLSRHFVIRNDYGLYEYTVYVYKDTP